MENCMPFPAKIPKVMLCYDMSRYVTVIVIAIVNGMGMGMVRYGMVWYGMVWLL